jgi:hypothetical protein
MGPARIIGWYGVIMLVEEINNVIRWPQILNETTIFMRTWTYYFAWTMVFSEVRDICVNKFSYGY